VLEPVAVAGFSPRSGDVGDQVTVTGTGFAPVPERNTVRLGTQQARVVSATVHELVVQVPPGRSGLWSVAVAGSGATQAREPFTVIRRPRITGVEPERGLAGTRVTLRGQNFPTDRPLVQVRLGSVECPVEGAARDALLVTVPPSAPPGPAR